MMRRRRLSPSAMVVALVALVLSVGGNVTAAVLITSASIQNNTIRSVDIRDQTIGSIDVANGSLTGADVAANSLSGADVADGSLRGSDVVESSLGRVPSAARSTSATNAGKVDGFDANSLIRVTGTGSDASMTLTTAEQTREPAFSLTAPAAGFVVIHGGTTVLNSLCTTGCDAIACVRHIQSGFTSRPARETIVPGQGQQWASMYHAWVIRVNPGVNTFDIRIHRSSGNGELTAIFTEVVAVYSPFGPTGAGPF